MVGRLERCGRIEMRVYRYERPDGGGPWFTRDGVQRNDRPMPKKFSDNILYGCTSLDSLFAYFRDPVHNVDLGDCTVRVYEVPEHDITKAGEL